jgi:hypothetical protein
MPGTCLKNAEHVLVTPAPCGFPSGSVSFHQKIHARPVISANNEPQSSLSAPLAGQVCIRRAVQVIP